MSSVAFDGTELKRFGSVSVKSGQKFGQDQDSGRGVERGPTNQGSEHTVLLGLSNIRSFHGCVSPGKEGL